MVASGLAPTPGQASELARTFGCVRLVYNKALEERTRAYTLEGRRVSYVESSARLTEWKRSTDGVAGPDAPAAVVAAGPCARLGSGWRWGVEQVQLGHVMHHPDSHESSSSPNSGSRSAPSGTTWARGRPWVAPYRVR
jgi:hypothetical protein